MKMKNKILFPSDGVVKKIYIKESEKIPKGKLIMELE
jgi:biotin carboxyl carrier protein